MKKTKNRPLPAMTIPTLLALSLSSTRMLLCSGDYYLICRSAPKHVSAKVYDALSRAGWITSPQEIGAGIAEASLTPEGKSYAERIRFQMSNYCQLLLFADAEQAV